MANREKNLHIKVKYAHFTVGYFGEITGSSGQIHPVTGHATVAALQEGRDYHYGVALCAPEDNFCRAEGRLRALRKLLNPKRAQFTSGTLTVDENIRNSLNAEEAVRQCLRDLKNYAAYNTLSLVDVSGKFGGRWWLFVDETTDIALKSKKYRED